MASAHAKYTGELGVCMATSGPGAIHLLNGLYDAKLDHQPVLAIVGQQARTALGGHYQQEVDLISLFKDVAGDYVHMAATPAQVRHLVDRSVRIAKAERTVTCIILPKDVQEMDAVEKPPRAHGTVHSGVGYAAPVVRPTDADLRRAADVLNAGTKVAMLVGAGALHATDVVIEVADVLGAGIAKALLGKAAVPDDLPFVTGSIGLLGTKPSWDMMMNCDTLLMVGSGFPYSEFLPKEGQARGVQIDINPKMLSIRYPMEVNLVGNSAGTLRALIPLLQRKPDRAWRQLSRTTSHTPTCGPERAVRTGMACMRRSSAMACQPLNRRRRTAPEARPGAGHNAHHWTPSRTKKRNASTTASVGTGGRPGPGARLAIRSISSATSPAAFGPMPTSKPKTRKPEGGHSIPSGDGLQRVLKAAPWSHRSHAHDRALAVGGGRCAGARG
ncbi:thiamine pyrophosphate-dependent acetolactate synthase large subunit-like protein [Azospirillum canadense]|nr:thiamine pyrophosphate-dependent acetolactate synthase large subunit-like protein [Azospirillum canadense]